LNVPMTPFPLDSAQERLLVALNRALGLEMSIVDAKLDDDGALTFLEANPQGAFLFVEALASADLTGAFCDFVLSRASRSGERRSAVRGSTRVAPRAGSQRASTATPASSSGTTTKVSGSAGTTPKSTLVMRRVAASPQRTRSTTPAPARRRQRELAVPVRPRTSGARPKRRVQKPS